MKTNIIWFVVIASLLLWLGLNIGDGRLRIGSNAYLNDTTDSYVALNKGFRSNGMLKGDSVVSTKDVVAVNSDLVISGVGSNGIFWKTYGMRIEQGMDAINFLANSLNFSTEPGNVMASLDSTNGLTLFYGDLSNQNYTQIGSAAPYIRTKLINFKLSGSTSTATSVAHGLNSAWRNIISWTAIAREDSAATEYIVAPQYGAGSQIFTAYIDSMNCVATTGGSATTILNDSVYFYITYHK